jgi:hypothetical protein
MIAKAVQLQLSSGPVSISTLHVLAKVNFCHHLFPSLPRNVNKANLLSTTLEVNLDHLLGPGRRHLSLIVWDTHDISAWKSSFPRTSGTSGAHRWQR